MRTTGRKGITMNSRNAWFAVGLVLTLALVATACGENTPTGGSGGPSLQITSPSDGASVSEPFTLEVQSSAALGDPSTGEDHVHLCFDGADCDQEYELVYGNSFEIKGLSTGEHTIEASLRNADHSAAGPTASITVTVTGGATSSSPTPSSSDAYGK
jgi:hypothetical protein